MRDYDESFKEMKKENFNLKLRIFFLEERMGLGKKNTAEELVATNLDLKVSHFVTYGLPDLQIFGSFTIN